MLCLLLFFLAFEFFVLHGISQILALPFTTTTLDQYGYLEMGKAGLKTGLFAERSPVYSAWISLLCKLISNNLIVLFYYEKIISVSILSGLMYVLGHRLFNKWTGLFFFAWTWNCKYLILETNGSHGMAAIFLVLAFIFLSVNHQFIRQVYIPMLFFSACCRSEMWMVIFLFVLSQFYLLIKDFNTSFAIRKALSSLQFQASLLMLLLCFVLLVFFKRHVSYHEVDRFSVAFMQNFTVNYVERNNLYDKYPLRWEASIEVLKAHFPEAKTTLQIFTKYPKEILLHLCYNLKLALQIPAIVIGSLSYPFAFLALLAWLLTFYFSGFNKTNISRSHVILLISTFFLIPISIVLKVSMRYYIQLIPVLMVLFVYCGLFLIKRFKNKWQTIH